MRTASLSLLSLSLLAIICGPAQAQTRVMSVRHGAEHTGPSHVARHDHNRDGHHHRSDLRPRLIGAYGDGTRSAASVVAPPVAISERAELLSPMWSAALSGPLGIGATAAATYVLMTQGPEAVGLSEYLPAKPKPPRTIMARPAAKIISVR